MLGRASRFGWVRPEWADWRRVVNRVERPRREAPHASDIFRVSMLHELGANDPGPLRCVPRGNRITGRLMALRIERSPVKEGNIEAMAPCLDSSGSHCPLRAWVVTRKTEARRTLRSLGRIWNAAVSPLPAHEHSSSQQPVSPVFHPADTRRRAMGGATVPNRQRQSSAKDLLKIRHF
jgi:hypothetical protein